MDQDRINLVTIEGNIGVGKSTLMESLKSFDWVVGQLRSEFLIKKKDVVKMNIPII